VVANTGFNLHRPTMGMNAPSSSSSSGSGGTAHPGLADIARHIIGSTGARAKALCLLNSVSVLVSKMWYRIPFNQSELSISEIPPTDSPKVRPVAIPE